MRWHFLHSRMGVLANVRPCFHSCLQLISSLTSFFRNSPTLSSRIRTTIFISPYCSPKALAHKHWQRIRHCYIIPYKDDSNGSAWSRWVKARLLHFKGCHFTLAQRKSGHFLFCELVRLWLNKLLRRAKALFGLCLLTRYDGEDRVNITAQANSVRANG